MEFVASDDEGGHFGVGNGDTLWVKVFVDLAANRKASLGGESSACLASLTG
jgi:hypothetical protein